MTFELDTEGSVQGRNPRYREIQIPGRLKDCHVLGTATSTGGWGRGGSAGARL